VAPWLASSESRYGALTASSQVERLTEAFAPTGPHSGLGAITLGLARLRHIGLPQEWWLEYKGVVGAIMLLLPALLLLVAVIAAVRRIRGPAIMAWGFLAGPLILALGALAFIVLVDEWPAALFPRYLNPMLPLFALFSAWAWMQAKLNARSLLVLGGASSLALAAIWVYMAGAYYFTNVGATLGIHAASG
jgi:hypothetical protein